MNIFDIEFAEIYKKSDSVFIFFYFLTYSFFITELLT